MSEKTAENPTIHGPVRVDERIPRLAARLEPGEIAVIEAPDLDRSSALSLLSQRPVAVLNAASSTTGRKASLGAQVLVENGVVLVDDLGSDLMTLSEGADVEVRENEIYSAGELVASGQRRAAPELLEWAESGSDRLHHGIQTFAQGADLTWREHSALFLRGAGTPTVEGLHSSQTCLVVAPGPDLAGQLRRLRRFNRDFSPVIIAVSEAADTVRSAVGAPDVIIGDPSGVGEKTLKCGAALVLLERPDGSIPGIEKITNYGLNFQVMATSASASDAAVLLADTNGAQQIVTVGGRSGIEEFFDQSEAEIASGFFIDLRCRDKLVSSQVVTEMYRPGISSWQLVWLVLAAVLVMAVAVFFTPWGSDLAAGFGIWKGSLFSGAPGGPVEPAIMYSGVGVV